MNKKIALIVTGGTVGMKTVKRRTQEPSTPADGSKLSERLSGMNTTARHSELPATPLDYSKLLEHLPSEFPPPELHQQLVCYKDSSAITAADWRLIAEELGKQLPKYDGFVVTHGTDTMAYNASALAYWFGLPTPKPIVFTGSCHTPEQPHTDAWRNLADAVAVAGGELREVALVFAGKVLRACQSTKVPAADDDIFSAPEQAILARLDGRGGSRLEFQPPPRGQESLPSNRPPEQEAAVSNGNKPVQSGPPLPPAGVGSRHLSFSRRLIMLESVPNFNRQTLAALANNPAWDLALLQGLGNGNLTEEFISFTQRAIKQGKHLVIRPALDGGSSYPPLQQALDAGALLAPGYSLSGLWVKLSWLMGQFETPQSSKLTYQQRQELIRQQLQTNYIGEILL